MKCLGLFFCGLSALVAVGCNLQQTFELDGGSLPASAAADASPANGLDGGAERPACDTARDPQNCGACGHSCGGGACSLGHCQPVELVPGQAQWLQVDGSFLYYASFDVASRVQIRRVSLDGGAPALVTELPADPYGTLGGLLVHEGNVHFTTGGGGDGGSRALLWRARAAGGAPSLVAGSSACWPHYAGIAVAGAKIFFWCAQGDLKGQLRSCPIEGCGADSELVDPEPQIDGASVFFGFGDAMYFTTSPSVPGDASRRSVGLRRVTPGGSSCLVAPDFGPGSFSIGAPGTFVATANSDGSAQISRGPLDCAVGASLSPLFSTHGLSVPSDVRGLGINTTSVLWNTDGFGGALFRCPTQGCPKGPEILAAGQQYMRSLVVTESAAYWIRAAQSGNSPVPGAIMKLVLDPQSSEVR